MNLKEKIVTDLYGKGALSGEELAARAGVTRAAVWKAVRALQQDGFSIDSSKEGYRLINGGGRLFAPLVCCPVPFSLLDETSSTNDAARSLFEETRSPAVIAARRQTAGRGRSGRSFVSEKDNGVYLSAVIPAADIALSVRLVTPAAAVACCDALSECGAAGAKVKWVNDIFFSGRKVAGILCEAVTALEDGALRCVIIGIGLNTGLDGLAPLSRIAGAVDVDKNRFASLFCEKLFELLKNGDTNYLLTRYRELQLIIGRTVSFEKNGVGYSGVASAVGELGELIVDCGGEMISVDCGEISLGSENYADR